MLVFLALISEEHIGACSVLHFSYLCDTVVTIALGILGRDKY